MLSLKNGAPHTNLGAVDLCSPLPFQDKQAAGGRADFEWVTRSLSAIEADHKRSGETHLIKVRLPSAPDVDIYLKDESSHPSGSLKHRLARSLFIYGLCNGRIRQDATIVEASSGSTAVSEAYFAQLIGLPFVAVMPRATSKTKIESIIFRGGTVRLVDAPNIHSAAEEIAKAVGGVFMDQFTFAERVIDWRSGNIASSLFDQMADEAHPIPNWIVMGIGTGGTVATLGRYIRYKGHFSRLCAVDVEHSAYFDSFVRSDPLARCEHPSRIEGVGRPRVEPSYIPELIDRMIRAPDVRSIASMRALSDILGRKVGGSTGANFFAVCQIAGELQRAGEGGSIASVICDAGDRYLDTYYDDDWLAAQGLDCAQEIVSLKTQPCTSCRAC